MAPGQLPRALRPLCPVKKSGVVDRPALTGGDLADRLAGELRAASEGGQPVIDEQEFASGKLRVVVIWDVWDRLPPEERNAVILRAYELAEGHAYVERVALASGLTVPEAHAAGMLPFRIFPALRRGDRVTPEQCVGAMVEEGASTLISPDKPVLRFATEAEAEAAKDRLTRRLADSEQVWVVVQELGKADDWLTQ